MAASLIQARDALKAFEQQLNHELAPSISSPSWSTIATRLDKVRAHCASALICDIEFAKTNGIDDERLWAAHRNVNDRFRSQYQYTPKSKPVECRKLDTEYLRYIKAAQRFYRGYIYNLSTAYGGIKELQEVAEKVETSHSGVRVESKHATDAVREYVLRSCCTSLSQLGDLSRYRETQLSSREKGPNWSHAIGYYELAQTVFPRSGLAQNQMAVVATADNNHFRSIYHLYLSLQAMEPHPHAFNNLKKALYKIRSLRETGKLFQDNGPGRSGSHVLRAWYLRVVSSCYHGKWSTQQDQTEMEYLQHLDAFIANGVRDTTLYKITLINIAAGHHARSLFEENSGLEDRMNSFLDFLRLNVKTLSVILQGFETELKLTKDSKLTPILLRLLPLLRLYSAWLIIYGRVVAGATQLDYTSVQAPLWTLYTRCLTLMVSVFPSATLLPEVPHLLYEDEDTIGFAPLHSDTTEDVWFDQDSQLKPRRCQVQHKQAMTSLEEQEHLTRVRYVLRTGLHLAVQSELVPISFSASDVRFYYDVTEPLAASSHTGLRLAERSQSATTSSIHALESAMPEPITVDQDMEAAHMVDTLVSDDLFSSSSAFHDAGFTMSSAQAEHVISLRRSACATSAFTQPESGSSSLHSPSPNKFGHGQLPKFTPAALSDRRLDKHPNQTFGSSPRLGDHPVFESPFHARTNSNESLNSRCSIWANDNAGNLRSPLGNGTFGLEREHAIQGSTSAKPHQLGNGSLMWSTVKPLSQDSSFRKPLEASPRSLHSTHLKENGNSPWT